MNIKQTQTAEGELNELTWKIVTQIKQRTFLESRNDSLVVFTHTQKSTGQRVREFRILQLLEEWGVIKTITNDKGKDIDITTLSINSPVFERFYEKLYKARKELDLNEIHITPEIDLEERTFYWPEGAGWANELTFLFNPGVEIKFGHTNSEIYKLFKRLTEAKGKWVSINELSSFSDSTLNQTISRLREKLKKVESRFEKMYDDKIDGLITQDFFSRKLEQYSAEKKELTDLIKNHSENTTNHYELAIKLFDFSQSGKSTYINSKNNDKKRQLLKLVFSEIKINEGQISYRFSLTF